MRLLALDTSSGWAGVALVEQRASSTPIVVAELGVEVRATHAAGLFRRIDLLLAEAGWSKGSLDAYAATRGPGSFTGIRIGLGTIQGLALASGRPCFGVTTLEALAEAHGPAEVDRIPVVDAGRGELYAARYDARSSPPRELEPPWLTAREALGGDGAALIPGPPGPGGDLGDRHAIVARAPRGIAAAAGTIVLARGIDGAEPATPLYVRPPDALVKGTARP